MATRIPLDFIYCAFFYIFFIVKYLRELEETVVVVGELEAINFKKICYNQHMLKFLSNKKHSKNIYMHIKL